MILLSQYNSNFSFISVLSLYLINKYGWHKKEKFVTWNIYFCFFLFVWCPASSPRFRMSLFFHFFWKPCLDVSNLGSKFGRASQDIWLQRPVKSFSEVRSINLRHLSSAWIPGLSNASNLVIIERTVTKMFVIYQSYE